MGSEMNMPIPRRTARMAAAVVTFAAAVAGFGPGAGYDLARAASPGDPGAAAESASPTPTNTLDYDRGGIFDEVRIRASQSPSSNDEGTEDGLFVGGEVLFDPFLSPYENWFLNILLRPRPMIGANVSTRSGTDQIYAGLTWDVPVGPLFLEASFGGTIHDGDLSLPDEDDHGVELGCRWAFHESIGFGAVLRPHWTFVVSVDHSSNNEYCDKNNGLTHVGAMVGYRF
jgi:hypothetical protein